MLLWCTFFSKAISLETLFWSIIITIILQTISFYIEIYIQRKKNPVWFEEVVIKAFSGGLKYRRSFHSITF